MIKALFKFDKTAKMMPPGSVCAVDTTVGSGPYRELSPFVLPAPPAKNFENLWQFSKVYPKYWDVIKEMPTPGWFGWYGWGILDPAARRYPMGKGAIPVCSWWKGHALGYIEARKKIYAPVYAENVAETDAYRRLTELYADCLKRDRALILLDFDAYDHEALGMSLADVINNPKRKMGHAFVLLMMLTGQRVWEI